MPFIYRDFDLHIMATGHRYTAHVVSSPAGQASATFTMPFTAAEVQRFSWLFGRTGRQSRPATRQNVQTKPLDPKTFGIRLFDAAFSGDVAKVFLRSLDEVERSGLGLRIRLRLNEVPELADLPWEYLYAVNSDRFLALSAKTPIVRYMELPRRERALTVSPPLRVLVIMSNPSDVAPKLAVEQERSRLLEALAELQRQGLLILEQVEQATLSAVLQRLRRDEVHILHYIGHGYFDPGSDTGGLVFVDSNGQSQAVTAEQLGTLFHDHDTLRLAFLNACEGARGGRDSPFAGVAQKLVQQGAPAVLAMQFPVSDTAAIALAHEFYRALADGMPTDAAVSEARKAMYVTGDEFEWGTPVLFSRSPDGMILDWNAMKNEDHMPDEELQPWWNRLPVAGAGLPRIQGTQAHGDVIIGVIGDNVTNAAIGKHIIQNIYKAVGEPAPQDEQIIEQKLAGFASELKAKQREFDEAKTQITEFQFQLLTAELSKPEDGEPPAASVIIQVGDWLLDNIPEMAEALTSLFATPAVGRVIGRASERAITWLQKRFGSSYVNSDR